MNIKADNVILRFKDKYQGLSIVAKASFWYLICSVLQKGISLISTPIFTRMMSTEQYGQFSVYSSWMAIFVILSTFRLDGGTFNKGMSKYSERQEQYVSTMQGIVTISCAALVLAFLLFRSVFTEMIGLPLIVLVGMAAQILFQSVFSFWSLKERYNFKYKKVVLLTILMAISNCISGVIFVLLATDKGIARILSAVLIQSIFGIYLYKRNRENAPRFIYKDIAKFALLFNLPLIPHYLSMYVLNSSDRIMIQKMCGTSEVALYSVVYNLSMVLQFVVDSINSSVAPWMYQKMEAKDTDNIENVVIEGALIIGALLAAFILVAPEVVYVMAGKKYMEAVNLLPCLSCCVLCIYIYQLIGNIEFYYNANKFTMYISAIGAALNLILNYIAIPIWGYVATGYTTLISYLVFVAAHSLFAKHLSVEYEKKVIVRPSRVLGLCFVLVAYGVVMTLVYSHSIIRYLMVGIIAVIVIIKRKSIVSVMKRLKGR